MTCIQVNENKQFLKRKKHFTLRIRDPEILEIPNRNYFLYFGKLRVNSFIKRSNNNENSDYFGESMSSIDVGILSKNSSIDLNDFNKGTIINFI